MKCPHCGCKVSYINGELHDSDGEYTKSVVSAIIASRKSGSGPKLLEESRIRRKARSNMMEDKEQQEINKLLESMNIGEIDNGDECSPIEEETS